jgi:hypothetical protein
MQKQFLFVTTLTPKRLLTPVRQKLFDLYKKSLLNQSYKNWTALLIGEEDETDGNFIQIKATEEDKQAKLEYAFNYIKNLSIKPDYVIRLDDDDIISPTILEKAATLEFDCFADTSHHFYDIVYSLYCRQKKDWIPNTVIHKTEHIFNIYGEDKIELLKCSHHFWHLYYSDKKLVFSKENEPVYLRTISPVTISGSFTNNENILNAERYNKYMNTPGSWIEEVPISFNKNMINWKKYNEYLDIFGIWKTQVPSSYNQIVAELNALAVIFKPTSPYKQSFLSKLKKTVRG